MTLRILTAEEVAEYEAEAAQQPRRRRTPCQCTCGRFAHFVRFEASTLPHGEAVTTVACSRCGEVRIR